MPGNKSPISTGIPVDPIVILTPAHQRAIEDIQSQLTELTNRQQHDYFPSFKSIWEAVKKLEVFSENSLIVSKDIDTQLKQLNTGLAKLASDSTLLGTLASSLQNLPEEKLTDKSMIHVKPTKEKKKK